MRARHSPSMHAGEGGPRPLLAPGRQRRSGPAMGEGASIFRWSQRRQEDLWQPGFHLPMAKPKPRPGGGEEEERVGLSKISCEEGEWAGRRARTGRDGWGAWASTPTQLCPGPPL